MLRQIQEVERRHGLRIGKIFHAGDGNLHCNILYDRTAPGRPSAAPRPPPIEIFKIGAAAGGTISGEHGVGAEKTEYLKLIYSPRDLAAMADVKHVFDPSNLANPGKVLPKELEAQA